LLDSILTCREKSRELLNGFGREESVEVLRGVMEYEEKAFPGRSARIERTFFGPQCRKQVRVSLLHLR
jgi:hypothetical protein